MASPLKCRFCEGRIRTRAAAESYDDATGVMSYTCAACARIWAAVPTTTTAPTIEAKPTMTTTPVTHLTRTTIGAPDGPAVCGTHVNAPDSKTRVLRAVTCAPCLAAAPSYAVRDAAALPVVTVTVVFANAASVTEQVKGWEVAREHVKAMAMNGSFSGSDVAAVFMFMDGQPNLTRWTNVEMDELRRLVAGAVR